MRITFLLTQSLESPSGLGRYWPLSRELVRLGHRVTLLALHHDFGALSRRAFVRDGVQVRYVAQMHVRKVANGKQYYTPVQLLSLSVLAAWRLMAAAFRSEADVFHVCKPHPMNGLAVVLPSLARRKPIYLDCDDYEAASNRFAGQWQHWLVDYCERSVPHLARGITTNTHFMAGYLQTLGYRAERIVYVPNGVDRERFACAAHAATIDRARRTWELDGRRVVAYVGSMSLTSHAVDLLLRAFAITRRMAPEAVLLMVGGGEDYEQLQRASAALDLGNAVRFTGRVPPEEVPAYYRLAAVSVDPVYADPGAQARSPLKLFESLAVGTPVVTGDTGDRREILAGGGGLLVAPGDAEALAGGLARVLQDDTLQARLATEALLTSQQFYWDVLVRRFARVYEL